MKPDIDTTKPIQVAYKGIGQWSDFCLIHLGRKRAYGFTTKDMEKQDACEWDFQEWSFRNKPVEPAEEPGETQRVKGFVNIYPDYVHKTRSEALRAALNFHIACIEIDVPEGHGLEE